MTGERKSSTEATHLLDAAIAAVVHTLVARKALSRAPYAGDEIANDASARPYIGELSIILPPAAKSASSTRRSGLARAFPDRYRKVCQGADADIGIISPGLPDRAASIGALTSGMAGAAPSFQAVRPHARRMRPKKPARS